MIFDGSDVSSQTKAMLLDLLRDIYGSDVVITATTIVNQHHDYAALLVDVDTPHLRLAVKLAGKEASYSYPFDRTAYWHQLVTERTSIPMPKIIAVDVSYRNYPWRYLIKEFIAGEEWATVLPKLTQNDLQAAYAQIGDAAAQLHSITFEQFGDINSDGGPFEHKDFYSILIERVQTSIPNHSIKQNFLTLLNANKSLFTNINQPRLCHEDLHPHNILFHQVAEKWQLATILDFDKAWAGHHEIDLAKLALWSGMTGDGFWERYTELINVDPLFPKRRPIYQLWWCLEYAANTPKHLADTAELCHLLNFPPIDQFD